MTTGEIIQIGNPILRRKAKPLRDFSSAKTRRLIKNLTDSLRSHNLVGIAACQVGQDLRIFLTEIRKGGLEKAEPDSLKIYINPCLTWRSGKKKTGYEGCGSVAFGGIFGPVKRPSSVIVKALNGKGERFCLRADGLLARIIQHENDHLDGVLFIEKVTDLKKLISRDEHLKRLKKKPRAISG